MTKQMIAPRMWTEVPFCGWVIYEGSRTTWVDVGEDFEVVLGPVEEGGRWKFSDTLPTPGESLAPDHGEEG